LEVFGEGSDDAMLVCSACYGRLQKELQEGVEAIMNDLGYKKTHAEGTRAIYRDKKH
jgi:hypothetical protein